MNHIYDCICGQQWLYNVSCYTGWDIIYVILSAGVDCLLQSENVPWARKLTSEKDI